MKVLVLAPMQSECENMKSALSRLTVLGKPLRHDYKIVNCGVGKVNAAAALSEELSYVCSRAEYYDLIVVCGYAAASPVYRQGDIVIPSAARYHDVSVPEGLVPELTNIYSLEGPDACTILTGDSFVDKALADSLSVPYGRRILFDMEATAVAQVCAEYRLPLLVLKMISDVPQAGDNAQSFSEFVDTHKDFSAFANYLELL